MQKQTEMKHEHGAYPEAIVQRKKVSVDSTVTKNRPRIRHIVTYRLWKGFIDRALAFLVLVVLSPLLILIALGIRLDSPGSPLLKQERIGKDGRKFVLYKFRSMYINHDDTKYKAFLQDYIQGNASSRLGKNGEDKYELIKDPRVTRFGAILRKTYIDEVPQFFNILKGDMSLVGPRPDISFAVSMYQPHHWERFRVTPGLTGLWQVTGRKKVPFEEQIRLDMEYIKRQSLLLDIKILLLTVRTILKGEGS
jgi:lipopolysaccharide/colanic/teichoic acid biosynthesis glycosyltransferase